MRVSYKPVSYTDQMCIRDREKGKLDEYELYSSVERLAPEVIAQERRIYKGVAANVDFYSGFVYSMLDLSLIHIYCYEICPAGAVERR